MNSKKETACYYCGMPASAIEHVIPRCILNSMDSVDIDIRGNRILTVSACTECNSLLGASFQTTLSKRKAYLKQKLRKRYKKVLSLPEWSEDEMDELGYELKSVVVAGLNKKKDIEARLLW